MLQEEHHVFLEARNGQSLLDAMDQLEPWLDRNDIRPVGVRHTVTPSGLIELQLTFRSRQEASLFEQAFCQAGTA
jgi:phage-related baseplate assembly protein